MFSRMSTFFLLGFLSVAAVAGYDYELRVESTKAAREAMSKWDNDYSLEIYQGFVKNVSPHALSIYNTVWQSVPKAELQELSGDFVFTWDDNIKVSFKKSVGMNEVIPCSKTASKGFVELHLGQTVYYNDGGKWSSPVASNQDEQFQILNDANFNYKAILFSKGSDNKYWPFYTSPIIIPGDFIQGDSAAKLGLRFGTTEVVGTFVGDMKKYLHEVDFKVGKSKHVCIDVYPVNSHRVVFKDGNCSEYYI